MSRGNETAEVRERLNRLINGFRLVTKVGPDRWQWCLRRVGQQRCRPKTKDLDRVMSKISQILSMAAFVAVVLSGTAFAHAHLKSSNPADKASVKVSPTELDLSFSEGLNLKFTGVKITGASKAEIKTGTATSTDGEKGLAVPLSEKLDAGTYTVEWHALSADGHKTNGIYSFTVAP